MASNDDYAYALMLLIEIAEEYLDHDERQNPVTLHMEKTCPDCMLCRIELFLKGRTTDG